MARLLAVVIGAFVALAPLVPSFAREPVRSSSSRTAASVVEATDLLAAETQGLVAVKYIPNDSRSAQIVITNRTQRPVTLRLPAAFAGVPVLAQMGMGGMGGGGRAAAGFGAGPCVGSGGVVGFGAGPCVTCGCGPNTCGLPQFC